MATTKELSLQIEEVTARLRAIESGQHVMTSSPGLPLEKWSDHGFVHRHEIKPLVRAINNGGGSTAELEERVEVLESGQTTLTSVMATKQNIITGGASTITTNNLTALRALVSNENGKADVSDVTATELSYLDGVTSSVQTQIDNAKTHHVSQTIASGDWTAESYTSTSGTVYAYKYAVAITGLTASSWVDVSISSGTFTGNYCIESDSTSGYAVLRTSSQPSTSLTFNIAYTI